MAFALPPKATLDESLALVGARELEALSRRRVAGDDGGAPPTLDESVHETRKSIKRLRALLRLYRAALPRSRYAAEDARLRELAHALGGARDAAALRESLGLLVEHAPAEAAGRLRRALPSLDAALANGAPAPTEQTLAALDAVHEALRAFAERLRGVRLERSGWAAIAPGFRRTYARGRRAFGRALERPTERRLHRFRAFVKRHQYQLTLLEPLWPEPVRAFRHEAQRVGELLGDDHDLSLLERRFDALDRRAELAALEPSFRAAAREAHAAFRNQALELAARVYAESPKRLASRFREYFDAWR